MGIQPGAFHDNRVMPNCITLLIQALKFSDLFNEFSVLFSFLIWNIFAERLVVEEKVVPLRQI